MTYDEHNIIGNYRRVTRIHRLTSYGFLAFLCLHLFGIVSI